MRLNRLWAWSPILLALCTQAQAGPRCATSITEVRALLGDPAFPLRWEETSMDDGKPLVVSLGEKDGAVLLEFVKSREGLWAQSSGVICRAEPGFEIRFTAAQIHFGPAAGWLLRLALGHGGKFTLTQRPSGQLHIATTGWEGTFLPTPRP
jgi:hypothetical protein